MLIGEFQHNIDEKGRIIVPSRFRDDLGSNFIVTKGLDNCLSLYSMNEWTEIENKIKELPLSKSRDLRRFWFSGASEVIPDKQGRIVIPPNLREYAGVEKDIVIIGASNHAEIWDKARWEAQVTGLTADVIADAMSELGF